MLQTIFLRELSVCHDIFNNNLTMIMKDMLNKRQNLGELFVGFYSAFLLLFQILSIICFDEIHRKVRFFGLLVEK